jgi:hypothetical protein
VTDLTGVTTYHNSLSRDGVNSSEYALTPSNVATASFGKLFSCTTDGAIYGQPLWVPGLTIGATKHNVVFVATQHDSLYAFDADASPCVLLWKVSLIDALHGGSAGERPVPSGQAITRLVGQGAGDIDPEVGILGTPVIDLTTGTLYAVSKSTDVAGTNFFQRLHGIDLLTGNEKLNGNHPVLITATFPGTGDGSSGGVIPFNPQTQNQRPALALVNGVVYVCWASHEDVDPYHGWVIGYRASDLTRVAVFNTTPDPAVGFIHSRGGIWMGGGAPAADSSNNLYLITGNGAYNGIPPATGATDFGDSVLKLSTTSGLTVTDWFTPMDQQTLNDADLDFGSGGTVVLVDLPSAPVQRLLIGGGKAGDLFLLNRDSLGHFTTDNHTVVQFFAASGEIFATPAYWQNNVYFAGSGNALSAFTLDPITGKFVPAAPSMQSAHLFEFPGATPSISAAGTSPATANAILWALDNHAYCTAQSTACGPAVLYAYDAGNLATELWNSARTADAAGFAVKFTVPTVANGKVYVGTRGNDNGAGTSSTLGELDVYGLKPN